MIIVNYKSKRQLKKAIGKLLKCARGDISAKSWREISAKPFFVTNFNHTFCATITLADGIIESVR